MVSEETEVVISGIGGCFPESRGLKELGEKLFASSKLIRPDPARWSAAADERPLFTGQIPDSDRFDSAFFGIPHKLIRSCDPLMGQMLERTFEAIVDAGVNPVILKGRNVGVLTATAISDAETLRTTGGVNLDGFGMVGFSRTMMANRMSYFFNFNGPSHSMDCSWESAAQALEIAASQIERGEVEAAVVASCNLVAFNAIDYEYNQLNWLSKDGESRPFDAEAQGFARSEGTVCLFLQRSSLAKRRYCSIVKSRSIFLGDRLTGYLRLEDQLGQFLTKFYAETSVRPEQVAYIEAAGRSILAKDAEELNAIAAAFKSPVLVGSVSGNLGHSEAPSAFVALVKAVIAMEKGVIPPTVNYSTPNPNVAALRNGMIKVVTEATPLTSDLVAVNGLSFSGTATHILLERNSRKQVDAASDDLPRLIILQARHEQGAKDVIDKIYSMPLDEEYISMVNDVFKTTVPAYLWRGYAIVPTIGKEKVQKSQVCDSASRPVWWVFSGMGSQWPEMGRELMRLPVFAAAVERCDRALRHKGVDITHILTTEDSLIFDDILNCFVGIATIQVGLVEVLRSVGVSPSGMVGHSVGELGCAYADGCFTAEQTVLAAYARGKASVDTEVIPGMMAAVGLGYDQIKNQIPNSIDIACHNSSKSCTLSGPADDVVRYVDGLKKQGIFAKAVNAAGRAYHSRYIKDIAPKLIEYLKEVVPEPKQRSARWISSSVPESQWSSKDAALCSAEYHTNNLLSPVLFEEACTHIPENAIVLEIAPRGLLQAILRPSLSQSAIIMSLTSRQAQSNLHHLLNCIGQLHLHNVAVDVNALYPPVQYPVSRGTPSLTELVTWDHDDICYQDLTSHVQMLINEGNAQKYLDISKRSPDYAFWKDRRIHGQVVVPFCQVLIYAWKLMFAKLQVEVEDGSIVVEDMTIIDNFTTNDRVESTVLSLSPCTCSFEILSQVGDSLDTYIAMTGKLCKCNASSINLEDISEKLSEMEEIEGEEVYQNLAHLGLQLGSQYQLMQTLFVGTYGCYAKLEWTGNLLTFLDSMFNIAVFLKSDSEQELFLPSTFIKLTINSEFFQNISTGTLVDVHYNLATNVIVCSGVKIFGLRLTRAPPPPPINHSWTEMKLEPYFKTKLTVQELVSASVRLASEAGLRCWADKDKVNSQGQGQKVLVVNSTGSKQPSSFTKLMKHVLKQEQGVHCAVQEVDASQVRDSVPPGSPGLLIVADSALLPAVMECVPHNCQLYCLTRLADNVRSDLSKLYQPILASLEAAEKYALVKRVPRCPDITIFEISTTKWLENLRKLVKSSNDETCFVVVSKKYDPQVLLTLALEPYAYRLRVFFLVGSVPGLFLKSQLFTGQLALGLPVNILSNGIWAFLRPIEISPSNKSLSLDCYFRSSIRDWKEVKCVSLNTTTCQAICDEIEYLDYSARKVQSNVMGVGRLDPDGQHMTPDLLLQWPMPLNWSIEEAATVPVAYSLAYYCVYLKARLESGDRLLVNDALSPVGQAVVAVALKGGAIVFASVHDDEQAKQLIELFPALTPNQVLVLESECSLNAFIRRVAKNGVDVVINCLNGKHLQDSINALAFFGRFIHLGQIKAGDREKIGMGTFVKGTTFFGVSLHNINNCHKTEKGKIQDLITKGIDRGIVKPLKKIVILNKMQEKGLRNFLASKATEKLVIVAKKTIPNHQSSLKFNPEHICIVAGPDIECILSVAQWLTSFGARKFSVLLEKTDETSQHCHQFNRLINQLESTVLMTSLSRLDSPEEADCLLKEVYRMGTVSYIICVSLDEQRVKLLEESSERLGQAHFVSLLCKGASKGAVVISRANDTSVHDVLPFLPSLLTEVNGQPRCFVMEDIKSTTHKQDAGKCQLPLPQTLDQLIAVGQCCGASGFSEVVTLSPSLRHGRQDLLPVFLVPATSPVSLQPLTRRLLHPAFCCNPPTSVQSIERVAEDLMKDILRVRDKGPFTLVGDSWNSLVALHIAVLLETQGHQVEMFLLEGLPSTVRTAIRALGETPQDIESNLVSTCLNLPDKVIYTQAQMKMVPVEARQAVGKGLDSLLGQLTALGQIQPPSQLIQGHVTLITASQLTSTELDDFALYCKQTPCIVLTGTDSHKQLIASYKTAATINENAAFSWNT